MTNETMQQSGQMSLVLTRQHLSGAVTARFRAWGGLIGTGELAGHVSRDGRIVVSGQLMMGQNPFACDLTAHIAGDILVGSATFTRSTYVARSRFTLTRS